MVPKPYDDLFIEPAGDYDIVYADYNATMDDGSSLSRRPYVRLTSFLNNVTKNAGDEVRFKCEATGNPLPLQFSWLKNHAPVEKNRKTKIKNRDYWSRLIITDLEVLDSGYYQCIVSNSFASVNTTSILRVNNILDGKSSNINKLKGKLASRITNFQNAEYFEEDFEGGPGSSMSMSGNLGRLPSEEEIDDNLWNVPNNAAGPGYAPLAPTDRWLDGLNAKVGDCIQYRGEACREYLTDRYVMIVSDNREDMYDVDRNLRAAMMFINSSPVISAQCKHYSHAVACYHMYKICDRRSGIDYRTTSGMPHILTICRKDCDALQADLCPNELALAAEHDLVGDDPKALLPKCQSLNPKAEQCIPIINVFDQSKDNTNLSPDFSKELPHWCYVNSGKTYDGNVSLTKSGKRCMNWTQSSSREFNIDRYPSLRTSKNHCRNPGGKKSSPWCFAHPNGQEEYCDISQCPANMYPYLRDREVMGTIDDDGSIIGDISDIWSNLSSPWQLAVLGGFGFLIFSLILLCCYCCCRRKRREAGSGSSSTIKKNGLQNCNGCSIASSAVNNAYYRKLNGTANTDPTGAAFELSSLIQAPPTNSNTFMQHHHSGSYAQYSPRPSTEPSVEPYQIPEIQPSQLQIGDLIGEGQFGIIRNGNWHGSLINGEPIQVAVKSLKSGSSTVERQNFEEEIRTIAPFDHPNVVRLLGVCYFDTQHLSAVFEYMVHGDLHDFLRLRAPKTSGHEQIVDQERIIADNEDFLRIALQIAYGMKYLSSMNFVHRDLAARNCLVADQRVIKIADFGLVRSCYEKDYYKVMHRTWLPVRWMSQEAIQYGRFSEATDVWSFGVTLWEIYSYGRQPYESYSHQDVIELISVRSLLECPQNCPTNIYSLMVECWHEHPERRPTFNELYSRLQTWSLTSPSQSVLSHQQNPSNTSAAANRGSRQSSSTPSASLLLGTTGNTSLGTAPSMSTTGFSVPSPAPMQTMMTLNGVHSYQEVPT
uniref:receptor protein-tyrosine kinase n=2 Tax=Onchocerca volvulus TaxID=6282 RepID=A0A8R1U4G6_ONCVO